VGPPAPNELGGFPVDLGALTTGLLTGLREGVEAALIVSIVLAYLAKTGNQAAFGSVWLGVGLAILASAAGGMAIFATVHELPEPYEQLFEGVTLLVAAGVVTWMLFWMRRQAANIKGELQAALARALSRGTLWGLTLLAFVAVVREGIETALFLVGQATAAGSDRGALSVLVGAVLGLAAAAFLGVGFYRGSRRINLAAFFQWTGVALVFIAAGLLSVAVHEFMEVGLIAVATQPVYDLRGILPDDGGIGQFLRAIFGYAARPEAGTLAVHLGYLVGVLALYLRPLPPRRPAEPAPSRVGS
jgi:high-affinity iron transporter